MPELDYSKFTLEELYDVERNIDASAQPKRYQEILSQITKKQTQNSESVNNQKGGQDTTNQTHDSVASLTSWTPLVRGGSNFATHTLNQVNNRRIEIKPSLGLYLFTFVFASFSLFFIFESKNQLLFYGDFPTNLGDALNTFVPIIFLLVSAFMLIKLPQKIVFDGKRNLYWKGYKKPSRIIGRKKKRNTVVRFSEIQAIQLLSEWCDGGDSSNYYSFELNLVLKDSNRINVIDHGNYSRIKFDANLISKFLKVPLWEYQEERKRSFLEKIFEFKF